MLGASGLIGIHEITTSERALFRVLLGISLFLSCPVQAKLSVLQKKTPYPSSFVFYPNDQKVHPGVVLLHGSEGGSQRNMWIHALLLAESGFTVMTLCWWDCGRDVRTEPFGSLMADIEIKAVVDGIEWFKKSDGVRRDQGIGLYGISKGAELAMIISSLADQVPFKIGALALHSPTDVVEKGANINWLDSRCWICREGMANCAYQEAHWNRACGKIDGDFKPSDRDSLPMWRWKGVRLKLNSRIEIEKFTGPILITGGANDTDWDSDRGRIKRIESSLNKNRRRAQVHIFQGEGHSFSVEAEQKRKGLVDQFFLESLK